ncbi:MoxR family ATPase [[Brevibacterium] frigoritolerans]|nr:MoxR family ATPase [Peribacillus frigoritolerans]
MNKIELKKDAQVINFLTTETGFLFGENIFIGMENSHITTVLTHKDVPSTDIEKALYEIEYHFNLLGLELKHNPNISSDIVAQKIYNAYDPELEIDADYEVIFEGELVEEYNLEKEKVTSEKITQSEGEIFDKGNNIESISSKNEQEDGMPNDTYDSHSETETNMEMETENEVPFDSEFEKVKLSREKKRKLAEQGVMNALNSGMGRLADICTEVKSMVSVTDSTIRKILLVLMEKEIVKQVRRGVYELITKTPDTSVDLVPETKQEEIEALSGLSLVVDNTSSNEINLQSEGKHKNSEDTMKIPVENLGGNEPIETKITVNPPIVETKTSELQQPVSQPIPYIPSEVEEEQELRASVFPPLYHNNEPIKAYLKDRGVNDVIINWVLFKRAQNAVRFAESPQEIVDRIEKKPKFIGKTSVLEKALSSMMNDSPLSLTGGAGSGKTTLVESVSSLLNMPLFTVNGSLEANKATLVGEKDLNKYRQIVARDGQQTKAMLVGGLLYIDEFNMIRPDVLAILNPAMDDRRAFFNDVSRKTIYGHKDFRVITAMNVGYTGVKKMNEATMERLGAIVLTYMGKKEMKLMLENVAAEQNSLAKQEGIPELQKPDIVNITDIYLEMTSASVQGLVPVLAASPRNSKLLAKHIPILGYQYALEMMLDKFEPNEQAQIVGVLDKDDFFDSIGVDSTALLDRK